MRCRRYLLAVGLVGVLGACAEPGAQSVYQPSVPPSATVRAGDFTIEISSPRDRWQAGEPIEVTATLTYEGSGATTIWGAGAGPIAFSVREIGGTRAMEALMTGDCEAHEIGPGPLVVDYAKSGAWSPADDPNETFYEEFFADRELRLPAGRWEVEAWARFATDGCGPYTVDTRAALALTVE